MATHHPIRKTVPAAAPVIPDKLYFRIGDVARICEVPAYVLRFWETEFPQLKPNKGGTGQRLYRKRDVEMALRIKTLLYDQGYTIPGARQVFKSEASASAAASAASTVEALAPGDSAASLTIPEACLSSRSTAAASSTSRPEAQRSSASSRQDATVAAVAVRETLRAELREVLAMLSQPVSGSHPPVESRTEAAADAAPAAGVRTMRPRLVLEPRPVRQEKPEPRPRLHLHQPGLFGLDDPGPAAS